MRRQRLELYELPDYVPRKNKTNDYGFDAHEQEHTPITGMGTDINVHDQWACESMGAIQDRTAGASRYLGQSHQCLSPAVAAGARAVRQGRNADDGARSGGAAKITGPACVDGIGPAEDWQAYCQGPTPRRGKEQKAGRNGPS